MAILTNSDINTTVWKELKKNTILGPNVVVISDTSQQFTANHYYYVLFSPVGTVTVITLHQNLF